MNLLLVDDDTVLRGLLAAELDGFGHQVTAACDGSGAMSMVTRQQFDAIVLDRMLPAIDGLSVLQRIRTAGIKSPVILLTALGRLSERIEGLEAGADDYLVKPVDPAELNARLHAVCRSREWGAPVTDTIRAGAIVISPTSHQVWYGGVALDLSKIEFHILTELTRNAGAVVTRAMLYERLWGLDFEPTTNLADAHIRRLRQKLVQNGRDDPISTVRGVGYKLRV